MKELGLKPAPWVEQMLASGRESFYAVDGTRDTAWDIPAKKAAAVPENPRTIRVEHLRRAEQARWRGTTAPRSGTWATGRCSSSSTPR